MAFKKNTLNQIMFPMVLATDFASIKSNLGAASVAGKFYGVAHGGSAAMTSGTISKAASLVRSGVFRQTLKATETNYDFLLLRFTGTSCADQVLTFQTVDGASDYSDMASAVWAHTIGNRVDSRLLLTQSMASDAASAAQQANSRALVVVSVTSDILSQAILTLSSLSDIQSAISDFRSDLHSFVSTTGVQLNASMLSDLRSAIAGGPAATVTASDISDIASAVRAAIVSDLSDILSAAAAGSSRVLVVQSRLSDFDSRLVSDVSDIRSMLTYLSALGSDIYSQVSDFYSDFQSRVTGAVATASDVASRVWAEKYTAAGNILASTFGSLVHLNMSRISDIYSQAILDRSALSDLYSAVSDFRSNLHSLLSTTGVRLTTSMASDVASQVWGHTTANVLNSRVLIAQSGASDAASAAQQANSRILVVQSLASDIYSNLTGGVLIGASGLSDIASAVWANTIGARVDSRLLVVKSTASDAASGVSDLRSLVSVTGVKLSASDISDLRSAIAAGPAATVTASDISDIASAVWAIAAGAAISSRVLVMKSTLSDTYSMLSDLNSHVVTTGVPLDASTMSDLRSAITAGGAGALTVSNISDLVSAVRADLASDLSDILSRTTQINSRVLVAQSGASDAASAAAQANSRALLILSLASDIDSALSSQYTAGHILTVSALSDIGSRVWADTIGARVDSRLLLTQSMASDAASAAQQAASQAVLIKSLVSDVDSALTSRASDILSVLAVIQSAASDAASAAAQANSRILLTQSIVSDVQSAVALVKAQTDNLPSAVKKNTQLSNFEFLMIDSADHITPKTGLAITATRSIDGAAFGACANAVVEVSNGIYRLTLAAADLNGNVITVRFNAAAADDRFVTFLTKP